jgi:hypothetical protein
LDTPDSFAAQQFHLDFLVGHHRFDLIDFGSRWRVGELRPDARAQLFEVRLLAVELLNESDSFIGQFLGPTGQSGELALKRNQLADGKPRQVVAILGQSQLRVLLVVGEGIVDSFRSFGDASFLFAERFDAGSLVLKFEFRFAEMLFEQQRSVFQRFDQPVCVGGHKSVDAVEQSNGHGNSSCALVRAWVGDRVRGTIVG